MKTFLNKIQEEKEILQATCHGNQTCGQCKIRILDKQLPPTKQEEKLLNPKEIEQGIRLACCHEYSSNVTYELIHEKMDILEDILMTNRFKQKQEGYGVIVDIGTTTVVMKWIRGCNGKCEITASFKNPQSTYGGDVISRIRYSEEHPHILNQILMKEIESKLLENKQYNVRKMIVCGNTVMTHLFLDATITSLGRIPFEVPIQSIQKISSYQIFKGLSQTFDIYTFPHISAFVGGDIVAGIVALDIDQGKELKMLVDLGTNGEIVLGNEDELITTSTAAGPAFEGVGISCGGPSIVGAITKVEINNEEIKYQTIGNKPPLCLCGSGLISLIAELKRNDIINDIGRFNKKTDKFYITDDIYITEKDIQAFQLAKAAIQAGVTTLFQEKGEASEIYISGGFGAHIEIQDLIDLKIFPEKYFHRIKNVSNSALSGAYVMYLTHDIQRLNHITEISQNINLAKYPDFNDLLVDGLYF